MSSVFPTPISGTSPHGPVMVIALLDSGILMAVDGDGVIRALDPTDVRIDWRFDWKEGAWADVSPYGGSDGAEEASDSGSEEVQGDVSDD